MRFVDLIIPACAMLDSIALGCIVTSVLSKKHCMTASKITRALGGALISLAVSAVILSGLQGINREAVIILACSLVIQFWSSYGLYVIDDYQRTEEPPEDVERARTNGIYPILGLLVTMAAIGAGWSWICFAEMILGVYQL